MTLKHLAKRNVSNAGIGSNENHNPNNSGMHSINDKGNGSGGVGVQSLDSTSVGSTGAAKYLINQIHLRPVETQRSGGVEPPKIMMNSNLGCTATSSVS